MGHKHHSKNELNDISKLTSSWPRISTINAPRNFGEKISVGIFNVQLGQKKKKKRKTWLSLVSFCLLSAHSWPEMELCYGLLSHIKR